MQHYGELETTVRSDTMIGATCYYKRRQASGNVRVYFRHEGHVDTIDVVPPGDVEFKYGTTYDIDFSKNPIEISTGKAAAVLP